MRKGILLTAFFFPTLLFICWYFQLLGPVSTLTDSTIIGWDHYGMPRCGLALLNGTNPFTAHVDYPFGPQASPWVTHPFLCLFPGIPLSYLPPITGFYLTNFIYLLVHILMMVTFALKFGPVEDKKEGCVVLLIFALLGFFIPWYTLYNQGQFHLFSVLALFIVLTYPKMAFLGFSLSAISKPILAPAVLALLVDKRWKPFFMATAIVTCAYIPLFLSYQKWSGWGWDFSHSLLKDFLATGTGKIYATTPEWNQHLGFATFLENFFDVKTNFSIRLVITSFVFLTALWALSLKLFAEGVILFTMWFFTLYAFGHEYHLTTYVPIILYLTVLSPLKCQRLLLLLITAILAMPTGYHLITQLAGIQYAWNAPHSLLRATHLPLYYYYVGAKPLCSLVLWMTILLALLKFKAKGPCEHSIH